MNTISWNSNDTEIATGGNNSKIKVWDVNGKFKYSVPTNQQRVLSINWKNKKPNANTNERIAVDHPIKVYLKINKNKLELIPLNNNRFALIDSLGNLIKGDKKDFIRLIEDGEGFTRFE